jgi:nucleotide-binding universal stress UspA family protein
MFSARANGQGAGVIVCGIDGSASSREALRTAGRLSDRLGLSLVVAHVVASLPVHDIAAGDDLLSEECVTLGVERAEMHVLVGRPAERLAELADEVEAELIAVGSRGQRPHQAALVGSVSTELLGLAPCPVLVFPARALDCEQLTES